MVFHNLADNNPTLKVLIYCIEQSGKVIELAGSKFGIESQPSKNIATGNAIWYGPYMMLPPGYYAVTISLKGGIINANESPNTPILYMNSNQAIPFSTPLLYSATIYANQLSNTSWTNYFVHPYYISLS